MLDVQVEFILMGGTFMSLPLDYRDYFVRNLHDALSGHSSASVHEAVRFSEQSRTKCIGLTIETRPDYCLTPHLSQVCILLHSILDSLNLNLPFAVSCKPQFVGLVP